MEPVEAQVEAFMLTVVIGMVMGLMFDTYRILRGILRLKIVVTHIADLLFWLAVTAVVFLGLLLGNWGEVRFYVFLGLMLGGAVYYKFFSRMIIMAELTVWRILVRCSRFIHNIIENVVLRPCCRLLEMAGRPLRRVYRGTVQRARKIPRKLRNFWPRPKQP